MINTFEIDYDGTYGNRSYHHVAITYDSHNEEVTLYIDGSTSGTNSERFNQSTPEYYSDSLYLGVSPLGPKRNFKGKLDEFRYVNRIWNNDDIQLQNVPSGKFFNNSFSHNNIYRRVN